MALSDTLPAFSLAWILETLAEGERRLTCGVDGVDDVVFGYQITSDKSFAQAAAELKGAYNFQICDGDPIRIVRREVNDGLTIDAIINQADCIRRGTSPAIAWSRVDPVTLPREVEIQSIDPDRQYATTPQSARFPGVPTTNSKISISLPVVISAQQSRDLAWDILARIWSQTLSCAFEHKDRRLQEGDVLQVNCNQGVYIVLVQIVTYNTKQRTVSIQATALLTSKGATIAAPFADTFSRTAVSILTEDGADDWLTEDGIPILTEG
jgi:hypothetical protein